MLMKRIRRARDLHHVLNNTACVVLIVYTMQRMMKKRENITCVLSVLKRIMSLHALFEQKKMVLLHSDRIHNPKRESIRIYCPSFPHISIMRASSSSTLLLLLAELRRAAALLDKYSEREYDEDSVMRALCERVNEDEYTDKIVISCVCAADAAVCARASNFIFSKLTTLILQIEKLELYTRVYSRMHMNDARVSESDAACSWVVGVFGREGGSSHISALTLSELNKAVSTFEGDLQSKLNEGLPRDEITVRFRFHSITNTVATATQ